MGNGCDCNIWAKVELFYYKFGDFFNIMCKNVNLIQQRYIDWYNSLVKEEQLQVDNIPYLPKEELYLKKIKRVRKPIITEGTVFAMKLPEDIFLYGKIICKANHLPFINEDNPNYVAMIYQMATLELEQEIFELDDYNCIIGPWIVSDIFWRNGTFFTVGEKELTEGEKNLDIGFYCEEGNLDENGIINYKGIIYDINGNVSKKEYKFLSLGGYKTIFGIEYDIRTMMIQKKIRVKI